VRGVARDNALRLFYELVPGAFVNIGDNAIIRAAATLREPKCWERRQRAPRSGPRLRE
jgi:hypothetical protein